MGIEEAWRRQGDVNGDRVIDILDITAIGVNYRKRVPPAPSACDLDGDGWISYLDLEKAKGNFGLTFDEWVAKLPEIVRRRNIATGVLFSPFAGVVAVLGLVR